MHSISYMLEAFPIPAFFPGTVILMKGLFGPGLEWPWFSPPARCPLVLLLLALTLEVDVIQLTGFYLLSTSCHLTVSFIPFINTGMFFAHLGH